jgi:LPS export ABC transporter protein LptC
MRRSEAARYARWCVGAALLLAMLTAGVYLKRKWSQRVDRRNAPAAAPVNVERQSNGLTFSKVEGDRKIFTITASKSTDFKDRDASLLESVKITIFGKAGDRNDVVQTQSCQYSKITGSMQCSGEVQMDLQSAADAEKAARNKAQEAQIVHVETHAVTFDRASGLARTDQPVTFVFPSGSGRAVGVEYQSELGSVRLLSDVQFTLKPPAQAPGKKKPGQLDGEGEVHVRGSSLDFDRNARRMLLHGPAEAQTQDIRLSSSQMILGLDQAFRAQVFRAESGTDGKRPSLQMHGRGSSAEMSADNLAAYFAPEGWVTKAEGLGDVRGSRQSDAEHEEFSAAAGSLDLWPRLSQPKELNLHGAVVVKTLASKSSESRTLQTNALQVRFSGGAGHQANKVQSAQTLAPGTLEWTDAAATAAAAARTKLRADKLEMQFGPLGKPRQLLANGNVQTERMVPGHAVETATARSGTAQLLAAGGWSQMDLQGEVKMKEGDRSARADHALLRRDEQTATLTGKAMVRDETSETAAPRIVFHQTTGEMQADGGVRSTDLSARNSAVQLAPAPANVAADSMQANSKTGRALYQGHARLWQGESVLEADSIELLRATRMLNANEHVRAVFPQAVASAPGSTAEPAARKSNLWHVTAGTLSYYDAENRAHLERDVVAQSATQKIRSAAMDLYFTRSAAPHSPAQAGAGGAADAQQISRAIASGAVTVEEGVRRAVAEHGEYTAADGKFVMTGGKPTLFDGSAGTTVGRQLTFFLADDTIIIDSENGSRTLTKHRVDR